MESKYKKNSNDKILEFEHEQSDPRTLAVDSKEVLSWIEDCMPNSKLAINRIESRHSLPFYPCKEIPFPTPVPLKLPLLF